MPVCEHFRDIEVFNTSEPFLALGSGFRDFYAEG